MKMTRRDFLKGLMVLTGASVVGLTDTEWMVADEPVILEAPQGTGMPRGRLGSLRIGDTWYAVQDAMITRDLGDQITIWNGSQIVGEVRGAGSWTIECDLALPILPELESKEQEIELVAAGRSFRGQGFISSDGLQALIGQEPYFEVVLHGSGQLEQV